MIQKDRLSQRIVAISLGLSAMMLSASLLIVCINWVSTAQATDWNPSAEQKPWDDALRGAVGLGIKDDYAYFVIWSQPNQFYKVELAKARNWYED